MEHATLVLTHDPDERPSKPLTRYAEDAHAWAMEQAELIRLGRFGELDIENLVDEVQDVARRERRELVSRLSLVSQHSLKWDYQPERRSAGRARTIVEQRRQVDEVLDDAPSLTSKLASLTDTAHRQGRGAALDETERPDATMPDIDPYAWHDVMTRPIVWPEP